MSDEHAVEMTAFVAGGSTNIMAGRDVIITYPAPTSAPVERFADDPVGQCPYPGLSAFELDQAAWFFGRDREVAALRVRLDRALTAGGPVVVIGASGAGKSSLVRCGLISAVRTDGYGTPGSRDWPQVVCTPTDTPVTALATALAPLVGEPADRLAAGWLVDPDGCATSLRAVLRSRRVLLVVDQVEELFTANTDTGLDTAFLDLLDRLSAGPNAPAMVVLGLRADYYGHCLAHPWLAAAVRDEPIQVGPLDPARLTEVLLGPARAVGLTVQPALVEAMLADMGTAAVPGEDGAGRLPLLAHSLRATWLKRHGRTLTVEGYRDTGGIQGAIATTAVRVFDRLTDAQQRAARWVFPRLVRIGVDTEDTRRRVAMTDLVGGLPDPAAGTAVVAAYTAQRLLTADRDAVTLTHEALLRAWPLLREWIAQDRAWLLVRQSLGDAARDWVREGRDPAGLYRGARLAAAHAALADHSADLVAVEAEFLDASIGRERAESRARHRRTLLLRTLSLALVLLLVGGVAVAVSAVQAQRNSARLARDTASQGLAALSIDGLNSSGVPYDADVRALAAWRAAPTSEALGALLSARMSGYAGRLPDTGTDRVEALAATNDGRLVASSTYCQPPAPRNACALRIWDARSRKLLIDQPYQGVVHSIAFSPNGTMLAVTALVPQFQVQLWDTRTLRPVFTLGAATRTTGSGFAVAFSPDGATVAVANATQVVMWNLARRSAVLTLPVSSQVWALTFSPDGRLLAAADNDGTVRLWLTTTGQSAAVLSGHTGPVTAVDFTADGGTLASASSDGTVRLWNPASLAQTAVLRAETGVAPDSDSLWFSQDGSEVLTPTGSRISGWDTATGAYLNGPELDGFNAATTIAVAPGMLFAGFANGDVVVENTALGFASAVAPIDSAAVDPAGNLAATGGDDGRIRLWDVRTNRFVRVLTAGVPVHGLAFAPDGGTIAATGDGQVTVWRATDGAPVRTLPLAGGDSTEAFRLRYSADGAYLVANVQPQTPNIGLQSTAGAQTIDVWNTRTWRLVRAISGTDALGPGDDRQVFMVQFAVAPTGHEMVTTAGSHISLWDLATGDRITQWSAGVDQPGVVDVTPDGRTVIIGNGDGSISEWDAVNHTRVAKFLGAPSTVRALAVSPDGSTVAVAGQDPTVSVDSVHGGSVVAILHGYPDEVDDLVFGRDGSHLIRAGVDGDALWWDLNPVRAVAALCQAVRGSTLSQAWHQTADAANIDIGPPPC